LTYNSNIVIDVNAVLKSSHIRMNWYLYFFFRFWYFVFDSVLLQNARNE